MQEIYPSPQVFFFKCWSTLLYYETLLTGDGEERGNYLSSVNFHELNKFWMINDMEWNIARVILKFWLYL
uniref:Uncharacterized protein n=1 Tax=Lepeophtheirus salmonis TaxID=72036 RepID=A0A0K2UY34_LEPSM